MRPLVVGVDGGPGGQDALALATQLAAAGQPVTLAHIDTVADEVAAAISGGHPAETARELLRLARERVPSTTREVVHHATTVVEGLDEVCDAFDAAGLVLGAGRRVPAGVLRARRPVAVAPVGYAGRTAAIRRVGTGWRGHEDDEAALAVARRVARHHGAELVVLSVVAPPPVALAPGPTAYAELLHGGSAHVARERLRALGVERGVVREGPVVPTLRSFAAEVDLLVLGTDPPGAVRRLLLGDTARAVTADPPCPVLVVPAGTAVIHGDDLAAAADGARPART